MAHPACLVCFISSVNGRIKKRKKKPWKPGTSSSHITNLMQFIFCLSISMVYSHNNSFSSNVTNKLKCYMTIG